MKKQKTGSAVLSWAAYMGFVIAASAQLVASPALAGEREDALGLCRAAIAEAYRVSADEAGAHFRDSTTTARIYVMRFDVKAMNGEKPQLLTCKVKRGALLVADLSPKGPGAAERVDLSIKAGSREPSAQ